MRLPRKWSPNNPMKSMRTPLCWIAALTLGLAFSAEADTRFRPSVKMYLVPWEMLTRGALTPADVKKTYEVYAEIHESSAIARIRVAIDGLECSPRGASAVVPDVRLVIEFEHSPTHTESFSADRGFLYIPDGRACKYTEALSSSLAVFNRRG
jgi:hypothetical protein